MVHDVVTRVDAGRTVHTLQLSTVPDIDTRRADIHALVAVDAIAQLPILAFMDLATRFSALVVVGDDHRIAIKQNSL